MTIDSVLPTRHRLSTKIVGALVGFLLLALVAIGTTLLLSWQLEGSSAAINETGSLRMHSYRLAAILSRLDSESNQTALRSEALKELDAFEAKFTSLRRGDPQRPLLLPATDQVRTGFEGMVRQWHERMQPLAVAVLEQDSMERSASLARFQSEIDGFAGEVDQLVQQIEHDSVLRMFWLRSSQLALVALALGGTIGLIYLMFLFIIGPVTRLREGIERMTKKDFSVRLTAENKDEFGELALRFNHMADRLQELYSSLEDRVRVKTAALAEQNRELALLYDTASFLQQPQEIKPMCEGFLQRISEYFGADGGSVRMVDDKTGNLHMVVHQGISDKLAGKEQCLKIGECLCGEAAVKKITVVHDLRKLDEEHKLECSREGFATVSIFHIYAQQLHIGFFNLHFRKSRTFTTAEEALLETLGQLLGTAIENLRLANREREMAISEERNLVAQGLHDSIAQGLTFLNIQVQLLEDSLRYGKYEEAADIVPALQAGVQESYDDVRELLLNFRSRLAEDDLIGALKRTIEKFRRQTDIETRLVIDGDGPPFPREEQLQVLFIVQEALSNIRKHAEAHTVEIHIENRQDFMLNIRDNGVGFDSRTLLEKKDSHVGLKIMRERAHRIHASLAVTSEPGKGTTVSLQLPREHRHAA
jgi:two-component system, NarL family, nitrate/nitrite sensor histidine kinase NarX